MEKTTLFSEPALSEVNAFIIGDAGPEICSDKPFRTKGGTIFICTKGYCKVYLDTEAHDIHPGCESIILPETTILFTECSSDLRITVFRFSEDMLSQASRKFSPDFFSHIFHTPVYRHKNDTEKTTLTYFSLLKVTYTDMRNRYRTIIATNILRGFLLNVYDKILKYGQGAENVVAASRSEETYNKFRSLVYEYGAAHHDVGFYADRLCITTRHLASITAGIAKESPKQVISSFLIQEIKILLTFSDMTMQQISDRLHFPDQSHMGRFFKQRTGISPMAYRKQEMVM